MNLSRKHPLAKCEECPWYTGTGYAADDGPEDSRMLFVGIAPGTDEVKTGKPFTGASGKLLNRVLAHHKLDRSKIRLTNVVACHPKNSKAKDPPKEAIAACAPRLSAELEHRETIVLLGKIAFQTVMETREAVTKARQGPARTHPNYPGTKFVVTLHPAACLRSSDYFPSLVRDIKKATPGQAAIKWEPPQFKVFDDQVAIDALDELTRRNLPYVTVDVETGAEKDESFGHPDNLLCVGIGYDYNKAMVVGEQALRYPAVRSRLGQFLNDHRLVMQNGKYDNQVLIRSRIIDRPMLYADTMLASYAKDERPGHHGLKGRASEELGAPDYAAELKPHIGKGASKDYGKAPRELLYRYNAYDDALTYNLWTQDERDLNSSGLRGLHDFLVEASNELTHVELEGVRIDENYLAKLLTDYGDKLEEMEGELHAWVGNPRSTPQVLEACHDLLLMCSDTAAPTLTALLEGNRTSEQREFLTRILNYRKEHKLYGCVDEETEILTQRGWLRFSEVQIGDETLSINPETGWSEWNTISGVHLYPGEHKLTSFEGREFSALTTSDHRWLVNVADSYYKGGYRPGWKWKTTETLSAPDRIPKAAKCSTIPTEPKYSDAFVELIAWIWTEGSTGEGYDYTRLQITQSHIANSEKCDLIRKALTTLCPHPVKYKGGKIKYPYWSERKMNNGFSEVTRFSIGKVISEQLWEALISHKIVDPQFIRHLTEDQLRLFIRTSILADGHFKKNYQDSNTHISQKNTEQLFAVQLACSLLGIGTSIIKHSESPVYGTCYKMPLHKGSWITPISAASRGYINSLQIRQVNYNGTVWCVSTRNKNWLARRHGRIYYTGNTYVKGTLKRLDEGRLYTTFKLHGTVTGRLSSANPNLQNIPRGSTIKNLFIPRDGNTFIQADYKQAEWRAIACLARDSYLQRALSDPKQDIHGYTAELFFGPNFTKNQRVMAKTFVFGVAYGRGADAVGKAFGVPVYKAQQYIDDFFRAIPDVVRWRKEVQEQVFKHGQVLKTPFGRRRRFWLITRENKHDIEKEALAFLPQSIASDLTLNSLIRMRQAFGGGEMAPKVRLTVHDSILCECAESDTKDVAKEIKEIMETTAADIFSDFVPFPVDVEHGKSWGNLKELV